MIEVEPSAAEKGQSRPRTFRGARGLPDGHSRRQDENQVARRQENDPLDGEGNAEKNDEKARQAREEESHSIGLIEPARREGVVDGGDFPSDRRAARREPPRGVPEEDPGRRPRRVCLRLRSQARRAGAEQSLARMESRRRSSAGSRYARGSHGAEVGRVKCRKEEVLGIGGSRRTCPGDRPRS